MGCGEKNLFSKRFFPHKTVLQQPSKNCLCYSKFGESAAALGGSAGVLPLR